MSEITNKIVPIESIIAHPRNYRQHPDEQLSDLGASLARFSQYRSVVLWERPNGKYMQVAGHGVLEAMKREDITEVRADVLPLETPQSTIDAILVSDNNIALKANDDDAMLAKLLSEQQYMGFDLASMGSDDETLRQMLESLGNGYLGDGEGKPDVEFKEYDETIADDLDTEMCEQCGKLCMKSGKR
jgi:ParB-like chromosome segregation protein Spo0J